MSEAKEQKNTAEAPVVEKKVEAPAEIKVEVPVEEKKTETPTETKKVAPKAGGTDTRTRRPFKKNKRTPRRRERVRSEFDQKILDIRRVTRVSSGGRRFSFSVALVVGNRKGKIGVGTGKAGDTALAIEKASKAAQKAAVKIRTTKTMSIPHEVEAKYNSARVIIMPAPGRGVIAGSALRDIIELGGLKDINGKIISGSKNKLNISKAVIKALVSLNETVKEEVREEKPKKKVIKK